MKKSLLFLVVCAGMLKLSDAKEVNPETASLVAKNFYQQAVQYQDGAVLELAFTSIYKFITGLNKPDSVPLFFVFNEANHNGFIIVSGDDNAVPVLGYAATGSYDESKLPPNFRKWLEGYKNQLREIITKNISATWEIRSEWQRLKAGLPLDENRDMTAVTPLLTTTWDQSPYYNDLCPYDYTYNALTVTGCPATAMAQIMKFWNYPEHGTGFHSYNHETYGTLSANFAAATYEWGNMPNSVTSTNMAVATLMYHCGVAVEMDYGVDGSGSYVIISASPTPEQCCEYAYKTYFGYDPSTLQGLKRADYSDNDWKQLIKNDLNLGRPVQYAGFGTGGHTFVCDGYDNNGYFHINWGWSGYADGYFLLDALNPGSGMGTYNSGQQALIGIKPLTGNTDYSIALYDNVTAAPNPVGYSQDFTVHTDIANFGTNTFNGDFCAAVFDENYDFVSFIEILSGYSLPANSHYTNGLDFTGSGSLSLLPGSYYIGIFYRPEGGDWIIVDDGTYSNMISFAVNNSNDIELYQDMILSCGDNIIQDQPFTVTLDIANYGTAVFNGMFDVSLYNNDSIGSFAENIETLSGASLEPGSYYDDVEFSTSGVSVSPGTYLLALTHKEEGGNWQLTGSTYHPNPITVIVQEPGIIPDEYENNDSLAVACALTLNAYHVLHLTATSLGSNLHKGSDLDFYKIVLPSGFDYTVTARVHDSYNSSNGHIYSCDVLWLYLFGSTWSDAYDDVMSGSIKVYDGGTVYFLVAPYFAGETGSYLLDIDISKSSGGGVNEAASSGFLSVFPNPAGDVLYVKTEKDINIINLKIFDAVGRLALETNHPDGNDHCIAVPVSNLATGAYVLLLQTDESVWQQKFVKSAQ